MHRDERDPSHSASSLSALLDTYDCEDDHSEVIMGSKTRIREHRSEDGPDPGYGLAGRSLAETEGRVGFPGLFENTLV